MLKTLIFAGLASAALATSAQAGMVVTFPSTTAIPSNNDFRTHLVNDLGLDAYAASGATISFDRAGTLKFEYVASESGFDNTFHYGSDSFTEDNDMNTGLEYMFEVSVTAGAWNGYFTSSGRGSATFFPGDEEFGIFLGANDVSGLNTNTLWIALDDQNVGDDDNHDDFIIKVTFTPSSTDVPEPAMLGLFGLGLLGIGAARRRRV